MQLEYVSGFYLIYCLCRIDYVSTELTQCDVAALPGSVAGGAAPGVSLEVSVIEATLLLPDNRK